MAVLAKRLSLRAILRRRPASSSRGLSVVEVLVAAAIGGTAITLIACLCRPMLVAQNAEQAATDEIRVMDSTLYRLQRDVRQSDPNGIFICTRSSGSYTCDQASSFAQVTAAPYFAILSAQAGGTGPTHWDTSGRPAWSGFVVYWLVPDSNGTNALYSGFGSATIPFGQSPSILNGDVEAAVGRAVASGGETVAQNVLQFQSMVDIKNDRVALRLTGATTSGNSSNTLSVQGDTYARN